MAHLPQQQKEIALKTDPSTTLNEQGRRYFQYLIGIINLIVVIGRTDVLFPTSSLVRFSTSPHEGNLARSLRMFHV